MPGWGKLVVGTVLGAAGALYATNEEFRKALPEKARDLPLTVRRSFEAARSAAREASESRRAEILRELEEHGGEQHPDRGLAAARRDMQPEIPRSQLVEEEPGGRDGTKDI